MGMEMSVGMDLAKEVVVGSTDYSCSKSRGLVLVWLKRGGGYPLWKT